VSAKKNVSADFENGWRKGVQVDLPAGNWNILPKGGGWSAWPTDDAAKSGGQKRPWTWLVNITANGNTECYGACDDYWKFANQKDAESFALQLEKYSLFLEAPTPVYFWIPDSNEDNRKGVILEIRRAQ
jgi:hypothetical protein